MKVAALKTCFTCSISYRVRKNEEAQKSICHSLRQFSEWWLGIGRWPNQKSFVIYIGEYRGLEEVNQVGQHYSKKEMALSTLKIILLLPITLFVLIGKLFDYGANYRIWVRIANKENPPVVRGSGFGRTMRIHTLDDYSQRVSFFS